VYGPCPRLYIKANQKSTLLNKKGLESLLQVAINIQQAERKQALYVYTVQKKKTLRLHEHQIKFTVQELTK